MLIRARFHFPEVVFGILLAVAIFAMGAAFWSSPTNHQVRDQEQQAADTTSSKESANYGFWEKAADDPVAYFTLWLVAFTGVLASVSIFQGAMMLRSDRITRESSHKEFRAYIRAEVINGNVKIGEPIIFDVRLINYGRTPARKVAFAGTAVVRDRDWQWSDDDLVSVGERPSLSIHPGDLSNTAVIDCDGGVLSQVIYDRVKSGESVVYARGSAFYYDIFGALHETHIALEFSGPECFRRRSHRLARKGNYET